MQNAHVYVNARNAFNSDAQELGYTDHIKAFYLGNSFYLLAKPVDGFLVQFRLFLACVCAL